MQDYRNLQVWQKGHRLALGTYAVSAYLQKPDAWPVRDQMFRAAISIPSNIAEGAGRGSDPDFRRFLWHSLGSCNELEYDLLLARDLRFLPVELHAKLTGQVEEVRRMRSGLVQQLKNVADCYRTPRQRQRVPENWKGPEAGSWWLEAGS